MFKKLSLLIVFISIFFVIIFISQNKQRENYNNTSPTKEEETDGEKNQSLTPEELITQIFSLAGEGKIYHTPFIVGKSQIQEVESNLGESSEVDQTSSGNYADYLNHDVTIGFQDSLVFDIRSFHSDLQQIHFEDIKKVAGEADKITYYKDEAVDQVILNYTLNSTYQLKWILPNPSNKEPNPAVHHISVLTEKRQKESETIAGKLDQMTIEEKIGQMIFAGMSGSAPNEKMNTLINTYKIGGIIFNGPDLVSPKQTVNFINQIKEENLKNPLPILFGVDQEGGRISKLPGELIELPTNQEIGKINNPAFSYHVGGILGKELKAFGFNINFAPVLDVNSNPNNPVIGDRSFGNDSNIVSTLGVQTMKGIQSQNIISVIKHFPGHGDTSTDSHLEMPKVNKTLDELNRLELKPFKEAIEHGADTIMMAHILLPKIDPDFPSSLSKKIITDILREQLNFNGVVITDDMTMKAITNNYDIGKAAIQSIRAGSDIIMVAHDYNKILATFHALKMAVENGEIKEERIDTSVERIIRLKEKYNINNERVQEANINELNDSIRQRLNQYME